MVEILLFNQGEKRGSATDKFFFDESVGVWIGKGKIAKKIDDMCKKAETLMVKDFMYTPSEGEYVTKNASLREAVHNFVMGDHQSLLVTGNEKIVGILRLTDVFMEIFQTMVSHLNKANSTLS